MTWIQFYTQNFDRYLFEMYGESYQEYIRHDHISLRVIIAVFITIARSSTRLS